MYCLNLQYNQWVFQSSYLPPSWISQFPRSFTSTLGCQFRSHRRIIQREKKLIIGFEVKGQFPGLACRLSKTVFLRLIFKFLKEIQKIQKAATVLIICTLTEGMLWLLMHISPFSICNISLCVDSASALANSQILTWPTLQP